MVAEEGRRVLVSRDRQPEQKGEMAKGHELQRRSMKDKYQDISDKESMVERRDSGSVVEPSQRVMSWLLLQCRGRESRGIRLMLVGTADESKRRDV